ncbi:IS3 family transposase [Methylotuvimicrobium sp. KM1]|uniref:IS3 family transposase n=1 Tax=Methylotuvimicrobium sp. KM1 TaxID=3377707 RepID=UPI00384BDD2F
MYWIDVLYTDYLFYGSRRMTHALRRLVYRLNRKRIRLLMAKMGLEAIYCKPNNSQNRTGRVFFQFYNETRPHQSLNNATTHEFHGG